MSIWVPPPPPPPPPPPHARPLTPSIPWLGRVGKQAKRTSLWRHRFESLEKRRSLEVEGYKTDIKLLRQRLKELEKQLYRLAMYIGENPTGQCYLGSV